MSLFSKTCQVLAPFLLSFFTFVVHNATGDLDRTLTINFPSKYFFAYQTILYISSEPIDLDQN